MGQLHAGGEGECTYRKLSRADGCLPSRASAFLLVDDLRRVQADRQLKRSVRRSHAAVTFSSATTCMYSPRVRKRSTTTRYTFCSRSRSLLAAPISAFEWASAATSASIHCVIVWCPSEMWLAKS